MSLRSPGFWLRMRHSGGGSRRQVRAPLLVRVSNSLFQEAAISQGAAHYAKAGRASLSARETEIAAFRRSLNDLESAENTAARNRALGRNHNLWSALVKDLALEENGLPGELKSTLVALGLWCMHYSTAAILRGLALEPLIAVNRNVLDGLLAQTPDGPSAREPVGAALVLAV